MMPRLNAPAWIGRVFLLALLCLITATPAWSAKIPSDNEQEILIRTTLMTFNDANLTGNYAVLRAKASREFQDQLTLDDIAKAFKKFRDLAVNIESIVADEIASYEDATIDKSGILSLVGAFKDDEKRVRYKLSFVQNKGRWKLLAIDVKYKE